MPIYASPLLKRSSSRQFYDDQDCGGHLSPQLSRTNKRRTLQNGFRGMSPARDYFGTPRTRKESVLHSPQLRHRSATASGFLSPNLSLNRRQVNHYDNFSSDLYRDPDEHKEPVLALSAGTNGLYGRVKHFREMSPCPVRRNRTYSLQCQNEWVCNQPPLVPKKYPKRKDVVRNVNHQQNISSATRREPFPRFKKQFPDPNALFPLVTNENHSPIQSPMPGANLNFDLESLLRIDDLRSWIKDLEASRGYGYQTLYSDYEGYDTEETASTLSSKFSSKSFWSRYAPSGDEGKTYTP